MTSSVAAPHHGLVRPSRVRHARPAVAGVLAVAGILATLVPGSRDDALGWVPLVPLVPLVLICASSIHLAAVRGILDGRWTPDVLASVGMLAALAWSVETVHSGNGLQHVAPVALATLLMVAAEHVTKEAGLAEPYDPCPAWLTPLVLAVAVVTTAAWWAFDGPGAAASNALSTLLVASPAALRSVVPVVLLVSARRAKEIGMTAADRHTIEASRRVDTIVLDKDGTITTGSLSVTSVDAPDPEHLRNLRWFAGALEHVSEHPVGRAIAKLSAPGRVTDVVHHAGLGVSGTVDRHPVRVGRPSWIGIDHTGGLGTQVAVEVDGRALGRINVADTVRPDAQRGVDRLRQIGLDPVLVSDRPSADTAHLAEHAGIVTSHADITADGRLALVRSLQAEGRVVAMVGDRGRDAAAMQAADLAITRTSGVPAGGIALTEIDVRSVAAAIAVSQTTCATLATTRRWALIGMLAPMPFAAAGLVEPLYAPLISLACMAAVALMSRRIPRVDLGPA